MNGIILAAGRGRRMGALTNEAPKCLTELKGSTLFDWQLRALKSGGLSELGVVRGYLAESLERPGLKYFHNDQWASTNMVRSLQCASSWLKKHPCIISYSDIVYPASTVKALAECSAEIAIAFDPHWLGLWKRRFADPLSDAETFRRQKNGYLLEIGAKTQKIQDIEGQYMGLLKFTPSGWQKIESYLSELPPHSIDKLDMTSLLSALLKRQVPIFTVEAKGGWYEVDSESDLRLYEQEIKKGTSWLKDYNG